MISSENTIIAVALLATSIGIAFLAVVETVIGFPGEWIVVVAFVLVVLLGFVFPQGYLLRVDRSTPSISRMGVITLMLIVLGAGFSRSTSGAELTVIWSIVGVLIAFIFVYEAREGYRNSVRNEAE